MRLLPIRLANLTAIAGLFLPLCAAAQTSSGSTPSQTTAATSAENIAITDRYLTAVQAEIVGKVDTRNAAAGQAVTAQTSRPATLADGTELPKGTKLVGRILRVQAYQKEQAGAILAITFDRAELTGGRNIPVRCVIRMVAPAGNIAANADPLMPGGSSRGGAAPMGGGGLSPMGGSIGGDLPMGAGGPIDSSPMGGSVPMSGSGGNSGGMGTGSRSGAGTNPTAGSTGTRGGLGTGTGIGGIGASDPGLGGSTRSIGDTAGAALGTTTSAGAATPERPVVSAGERLSDAPRRTALPGVMLSNSTAAGVSGTLSAFDRNVSLDSNTQITLGVITR